MQPSFELFARQIATIERIIWTLTFAAQLVLLVVLVGRDRARRYPWFTACTALFALQLLAGVLLSGRMARLPLQETLITLNVLGALVSLLVVVEMARKAFAGAQRSICIVNTAGLLLVCGGLLFFLEPWPAWNSLALDSLLGKLLLMQLVAQKGDLLVALLTLGLGLLVFIFGGHYKSGWRSHTQSIVIGLFAVAVSMMAWETAVLRTLHYTVAESSNVMRLRWGFAFAHNLVYLAALVWWIVWLWQNEPGADKQEPSAE